MKPFITAGEDWCSFPVDAQKYLRRHVVPSFQQQQQQIRSLSLGCMTLHKYAENTLWVQLTT